MLDSRIEIFKDGKWIESFDIREGDTFRLHNSKGEIITDKKGRKQFVAASEIFNKFGDSVVNVY